MTVVAIHVKQMQCGKIADNPSALLVWEQTSRIPETEHALVEINLNGTFHAHDLHNGWHEEHQAAARVLQTPKHVVAMSRFNDHS